MRHDRRTWGRAAAWSLGALTLLELVALLTLLALNAKHIGTGRMGADAILAIAVAVYAASSQRIIGRLPGNAIGWLLGLIGLSLVTSMFMEQYALYGLATARGSVPAAELAGWAAGELASLAAVLVFFLILLFPDGRLPSHRWRPLPWAMFLIGASWLVGQLQTGITVSGGITDATMAAGITYPNPAGLVPRQGWLDSGGRVIFVLGLASAVLAVISVFVRRRGASVELRKQLAWLGYVGLMTGLWAVVLTVAAVAAPRAPNWFGTLIWTLLVLTPAAGIPLACAVAVLKYRLYEIDRLISRTVAYAIVTGLLIGIYAGLVLLITQVLQFHGSVAVAVSTLAAAALFTPLRSRVQQRVDHRFNRARYNADQTVTAFAARLKEAVD